MNIAIIVVSEMGMPIALTLKQEIEGVNIYSTHTLKGSIQIPSIQRFINSEFHRQDAIIFIGALGICVRAIAGQIAHKHRDPAVINIDSTGRFVISVLSGHVGGANDLSRIIAGTIGAEPVITTQSDNMNLWPLDTIAKSYNWKAEAIGKSMNGLIADFVNRRPTVLLLDTRDNGTFYLEQTFPPHVKICYDRNKINWEEFEMLIAVTPYRFEVSIPALFYRPKALHLGVGCRKACNPQGVPEFIVEQLHKANLSEYAIASISTIELKKDEPLLASLQRYFPESETFIYTAEELDEIKVPNPSEKVEQVTGSVSVSEASAILSASGGKLLLEKQKGSLSEGNQFTFAVALDRKASRSGHVEIVGAGPGDPDLISVRGRAFLKAADLILYAGSLVPRELTYCAKGSAVIRSSASMNLEEQFALMKSFYDRGLLIVRLHTGDPCIYGAIQEQMNFFDQHEMSYHITPGISSFQAAAAALKSQFTIPEKVQTIVLTRGEGRTPMPEKEKLHMLAQSQSTMCIFLSAGVVDDVQADLLQHYPPATPVAVCYKLTWKDERIYLGTLKELAQIVKEHNLTLTTMIVVGEAIGNRKGLSRLYANEFKHLFRR